MKEVLTIDGKVNEDIIAKTTKCSKSFACLNGSDHKCCTIKDCINQKVHFLDVKDKIICSYVVYFGNDQICTCPVRKEIYNENKI